MASCCDITKGKGSLGCKNAVSGLSAIYIVNFEDFDPPVPPAVSVFESTEDGHLLNSVSFIESGKVFKFALKNSGNTYQEDITSNRDNGTTFFNQVLTFILTKLSAEMHFQIKMMAWGRPVIFVENTQGQVFVMGARNGNEITGNAAIGGTLDSLNGYTLTATGTERAPAYFLTDDAVAALKLLVSSAEVAEPTDPEVTCPPIVP